MLLDERDKSYLYDILTYSKEIAEITKFDNHESFITNRIKRLAVERLVEIVGEAANHISEKVLSENPDIPWSKIIGLRNKIVHDYGEILTDRIWLVATVSITELVNKIESMNIFNDLNFEINN